MDLQFAGKVAAVTGSSRGLGYASAKALAAEGCSVAISARGAERLEAAAAELRSAAQHGASDRRRAGGRVHQRRRDAFHRDTRSKTLGGLDILINNVGLARGGDLESTTDAEWQEAFDQTLYPTIRASRAALPHLRRRGGGAIVIVSSIFGREAGGRMTYNAVKAAEISLTKSLAQQLAQGQHPRRRRGPGIDSLPRRLVAQTSAGGSAGHRGVREARDSVQPLRPRRRSRRRGRLSCLTARQLDQRHHGRRRRIAVADVLGGAEPGLLMKRLVDAGRSLRHAVAHAGKTCARLPIGVRAGVGPRPRFLEG